MNKINKLLLTSILAFALTGCSFNKPESLHPSVDDSSTGFNPEHHESTDIESSEDIDVKPVSKQGVTGEQFFDYRKEGLQASLPTKGNPKCLVVPVMFKGDNLPNANEVLKDIDIAFTGDSSQTSFESVNSYYQKSSYHQLDINFDVVDRWVTLDKSLQNVINYSEMHNLADPTYYIVDYVYDYLRNSNYNMKDYDTNNDGYIDGLWLVYGRNYNQTIDMLWAYTFWTQHMPNLNKPTPNVFCWASYNFMYDGGYPKPDAHTFIHETGHMLGLDDYYDYDNTHNPCGSLDMMDHNVGDHNAYSKYLYGWITPKYIKKEQTVTIHPFESSGDALILPIKRDNYETPFEEYLIIEFYSPTGLNESDSRNTYGPSMCRLFTEPGIKIYHVDSRLGKCDNRGLKGYESNLTMDIINKNSNNQVYYDIQANNTGSYSYNKNEKLLKLISASNQASNYYYDGYNNHASNKDLFRQGDSLGLYKAHQGYAPYRISIDSITNGAATLTFYN